MLKVGECEALQLVEEYLQGDQKAATALVKKYRTSLRRQIVRALRVRRANYELGNAQVMEDILQNTFYAIFKHDARVLRNYDRNRGMSLRQYLAMVADRETNNFLDHKWTKRRGGRYGESLFDSREPLPESREVDLQSPEEICTLHRIINSLEKAVVERLSSKGQMVFRLLYLENMTTNEIQKYLRVSADCVYSWRRRIRLLMGEILGNLGMLEAC